MKRAVVLLLFLAALSLVLCGCSSKKALFDSEEEMISAMEGTYSASGDHSGEYIIINKENVIKFDFNTVFAKDIDSWRFGSWVVEKFPDEDWSAFDLDVLLEKPYTNIHIEATSADIKNSRLSGLSIGEDGTLYGAIGGEGLHPFKKLSSSTVFPIDEIKNEFPSFKNSLIEYEISEIVKKAEKIVTENEKELNYTLEHAVEYSYEECTASAETIAECAFESMKSSFRYPASAEVLSYSSDPVKDPYGRVITNIRCRAQNGFGNYITEDYYVLLQSCSDYGRYTYKSGSNYIVDDYTNISLSILMTSNDFNKAPGYDAKKDSEYLSAIKLAENGDYKSAVSKLEKVKGYRSADEVKTACENYIILSEYKKAVDLFADKKYSEAAEKLASVKTADFNDDTIDLNVERIILICGCMSENNAQ